jgi:hypothetical protein
MEVIVGFYLAWRIRMPHPSRNSRIARDSIEIHGHTTTGVVSIAEPCTLNSPNNNVLID